MKTLYFLRIGMLAVLALAACQSATASPTPQPLTTPTVVPPATETLPVASDGLPDLGDREIRVATQNAYPPFNFIDAIGQPIGYDYDLLKEACQRLNCRPAFTQTSAEVIEAVLAGRSLTEFDVIANGLIITADRAQQVDFSTPYLTLAQQLLVRVDEERFSDADGLKQMAGLRIGIQLGTAGADIAAQFFGADGLVEFADDEAVVKALLNREIDATLIDNVAGEGYLIAHPNQLKLLGPGLNVTELGLAFPKGSPLRDAFNQALAQMQQDGTLSQLFSRWLLAVPSP